MSGKVFQIKKNFENLHENNNTALPVVSRKNHLFKRSATSFELLRKHEKPAAATDPPKTPANLYAKVNKIPKSSSETFSRFNVDPLKRSSVRRSPAFRMDKPNLIKQTSVSNSPVDENEEIKEFLVKKSQTTNLQTCLTNSMKAALRQPLPLGPPPKKPPRLSANSSPPEIKEKICFLENHLVIRKQQSLPTVSRHNNHHHILDSNHASSNFLDCLVACHRNPSNTIYDSFELSGTAMVRDGNQSNSKTSTHNNNNGSKVNCGNGKEKVALNQVKPLNVFNGNGKHEDQQQTPIYMVPFSHGNNLCPQNHQHKDAHYLCTIIDDSLEDSGKSVTDKDEHSTIGKKTYDEIAILVDAAFNCQQSTEMGNGNDSDSVGKKTKVSRTLTEKRKDYVRRASANPEKRMETYQTLHRTFKSPILKTFSVDDDDESMKLENVESIETTNDRIAKYKRLMEENQPSMAEIKYREKHLKSEDRDETPLDSQQKLFQVCLLVGYNTSTKSAYLKMKYPPDEEIPDNIEQLIFPSTELITNCGRQNQEHCLILTDEHGFKIYGYCRRIYPENSEFCLPLCYCVISVTKSLGFFHKLLKEIESRHGQSEQQMDFLLKNLQDSTLPLPGKYLHAKIPLALRPKSTFSTTPKRSSPKRLSLDANPKWLQNSPPIIDDNSNKKKNLSLVEQFEENKKHQQPFDLSLINRSLIVRDPRFDEILIRRPSDLRLENIELSALLDCMGVENLLIVFSNLLLERKVILQSSNISMLSKSIIALQTILYPFQWQFTIVTIIPSFLIHICEAPFPVIAGVLEEVPFEVEDGIVINLDTKRIVQTCNDEQTIIPDSLRESLRLSLEMVDLIDQGEIFLFSKFNFKPSTKIHRSSVKCSSKKLRSDNPAQFRISSVIISVLGIIFPVIIHVLIP
ncbi:DENND1A.2 family protein [Megaselia abdita]